LWYPVKWQDDRFYVAARQVYAQRELCAHEGAKSGQQCWDEEEAGIAEALRRTAGNPYLLATGGSYSKLLLWLPVTMLVPPSIIYGILVGLSKLGLWIVNGFRA
jgi:hypothetical protein